MNSNSKKEKYFVLSILFLVVILLSIPILTTNIDSVVIGDDYGYHLSRIDSLAYDLKFKKFPVKIHSLFLNGYGYGTGLFYPNFFLYIPALIEVLGVNLGLAYKIFMLIFIIFFTAITYISFKYIQKDKCAVAYSTLLYVFSSSTILNMYYRFALGEVLAMAFIPLVICGIYDFINENFSKPCFMLFGFLGLIFSHTITLSTCLIIVFLTVLTNLITSLINNNVQDIVNKLKKLTIVGFVVLSLSSCYWCPMLEQFAFCKRMSVFVSKYSLASSAVSIQNFLNFSFDNRYRISLFLFLCLFARLLQLIAKKSTYLKQIDNYLIIGIIFFIVTTKLFPWKYLESIFYYIQFPWRLLTYVTIYLSLGVGNFLVLYLKNVKYKTLILYVLLLPTIIFNTTNLIFISKNNITLPNNICNKQDVCPCGVGMEWLPLDVNINLLNDTNRALTSDDEHIIVDKQGVKTIFSYNGNCEYIDVPLIYYKGYTAKLYINDGTYKNLKVEKSANNGLVRVLLNRMEVNGKIVVDYTGTFIQHFSYLISIVTFLLMIYYIIKQNKKKSINSYD